MRVLITYKIFSAAEKLLKKHGFSVSVNGTGKKLSKEDLIKKVKNADAVICNLFDKIDKDVIDAMKKCRIIANNAVGFNNIDVEYANSKGIAVTNTPGILTDATADLAMALLLSCARHIPQAENFMRENKFTGWLPELFLGKELNGKTCGVIGFGRIGQAFAKRAAAFGCRIIYFNRSRKDGLDFKAKKVRLETLLKNSDFISLHLPLNEKTNNLISKEKLDLLKPDSILINTARGEIIDENYLIHLLKKKKITSAGFDVYLGEPNVNPELLKLKNVVLLPHIGSAAEETRGKMAELCAMNIIKVLSGEKPITPVGI